MMCRLIMVGLVMSLLVVKGMAAVPAVRPCTNSDLDGLYVLTQFKKIGDQDPGLYRSRYHFLQLTASGSWLEVSINRMPTDPVKMLNNFPKDRTYSYALDPAGRLVVKLGEHIEFKGSCAVALGESNGFKANDLILSGQAGNPGELHELFQRWIGQPYAGAATAFDPAPSGGAASVAAAAAAGASPSGPASANVPPPVKAEMVTDASGHVSVVVTNQSNLPMSAFMVVYRNGTNWGGAGIWSDIPIDACLQHHAAWQPKEQWQQDFGSRDAMPGRRMDAYVGAAIFTDGSTWGDATILGRLKQYIAVKRGDWQGTC